jgi:hypothetical protein
MTKHNTTKHNTSRRREVTDRSDVSSYGVQNCRNTDTLSHCNERDTPLPSAKIEETNPPPSRGWVGGWKRRIMKE